MISFLQSSAATMAPKGKRKTDAPEEKTKRGKISAKAQEADLEKFDVNAYLDQSQDVQFDFLRVDKELQHGQVSFFLFYFNETYCICCIIGTNVITWIHCLLKINGNIHLQ